MPEQLYACEESALIAYLDRLQNATAADQELAASMFSGQDEDDETDGIYTEKDGEAVIRIDGPLTMGGPPALALLFGYGGTGYRQIMAACDRARKRKPRSVTLAVNSPGGEVAGVDQAWQAIQAMAREIPTTAENHGLMASAAYWLASAAPRIVSTSPATEQGSIGVIIVGIDDSKMGEKLGMRRVKIVSRHAPDKGADVDTAKGRQVLQERADALESVFFERVAAGRRTTVADVAEHFGQGALLIGREALRVGMIDEIVAAVPAAQPPAPATSAQDRCPPAATVPPSAPQDRRSPMTLNELLQANPGVRAEYEAALKAEREAGRADIQARIAAAKPFLALQPTKGGYDTAEVAQIAKLATDVIAGTEDAGALRSFVRLVDMSVEKRKAAAAQAETAAQGETPPQHQPPNAELAARAASLKIDVGAVAAAAKANGLDPTKAIEAEVQMRERVKRDRAEIGGV